ncbi:hypothetical protein DDB_G0287051 [Dictyostelium discoideum AX4]|uniref:Uncharacterized protein n=1 Tax=Dictyostelium discoideum TaxID=44689 RepID=Q54KX6_DICDI|nr:hypothetical protein DDB_G0287051 [Dictyostelium discoideum AX4]EAL63890.1 hypothetical protein DDB_G0287051 [Dictyostelium discoideum AX4]|eukprot:XP_637394.1 hypothetical protein DDB_G0287051 [Dictyostelium discoideum AX4]
MNLELKNIKEILDKLTKAIVDEKIIISKVGKSELMLLGLDNNFKIKKINQPSISQQQLMELKSFNVFEWKENEKYYESTMDINNYFHYIIDQETEDMENMYLSNISNQHTALKCQVGDIELSGSGDYLLVINGKGNPEKRFKLDLDYVKNPSNFEFDNVYLGFEIKSTSTINEFQGIAELIAITRKSNGLHPILHISTNFNDNYIFSFWDIEGNVNWVKIERKSAINLIQSFVLKSKEFPKENFYNINGINMYSKSLQ